MSVHSPGFPEAAVAAAATAATATAAAAARAAAMTTAAAAEAALKRSFVAAKRFLFPSELQGWLLLLLLVQQVLLLGLLIQRQHLVQQREETQNDAMSVHLAFQEQQLQLLNSRGARLGLKQQQQEAKEGGYCRCKPCARIPLSADLIDVRDRFKHTTKEIESHVTAILGRLDAAATAVRETYEGVMRLPWRRRLESKLEALKAQ